jgi:uncharacterized membrane protein YphA (DoxX/SURF4 family)
METTIKTTSRFNLSDKTKGVIADLIAYIFIAIFIYTATDKFWKIDDFVKFMSRLDIIGPIGAFLAWTIPIIEVGISILLLRQVTKRKGLIASSILMILFTVYLIYMKLTAETLPCHCGGVIALLSWRDHIYLNIILIVLSVVGVLFSPTIKNNNRKAM